MTKKTEDITLKSFEAVNDFLLVNFSHGREGMISFKYLRDHCPCASCAGETDVFGNIYKGPAQLKTEASYRLQSLQPVGYYGLRPVWADGHDSGIYSARLLLKLMEKSS